MTRSHSTHSAPAPKKPRPQQASTRFEKPDSEQAAAGAPAHEQSGSARKDSSSRQDDVRHGYSQDSGYQGSGGNAHEGEEQQRSQTEVSEESRTPFDEDASRSPRR